MTNKTNYPQIENAATKLTEIEAIRNFAASAGNQTYIASLLNAEALEWIEEAIKDDVCPDLFGAYQFEIVARK